MNVLVDFEILPWEAGGPGVRAKSVVRHGRRARLVEFSEGFAEPGWCTSGHEGQVLEGQFTLRFKSGGSLRLNHGDVVLIPAGEEQAHRPEMQPGDRALLLLFEDV